MLVEISIVLASGRSNGGNALREAAAAYKVKQEFAAKEKAKKEAKPIPSGGTKSRKAA
jgi:ParB family chromosome partitioning protein